MKRTEAAAMEYADSKWIDPRKMWIGDNPKLKEMYEKDLIKEYKLKVDEAMLKGVKIIHPGKLVGSVPTVSKLSSERKCEILAEQAVKFLPKNGTRYKATVYAQYRIITDSFQMSIRMRDYADNKELAVDFEIDPDVLEKAAPGDFSAVRDAVKGPVQLLIRSFALERLNQKEQDNVHCEEEWTEVDETGELPVV